MQHIPFCIPSFIRTRVWPRMYVCFYMHSFDLYVKDMKTLKITRFPLYHSLYFLGFMVLQDDIGHFIHYMRLNGQICSKLE